MKPQFKIKENKEGKLESKYHILNSSEINYINEKIIDNDTSRAKI